MKDQVSIPRVALLHPKFRQQATDFINDLEAKTGRVWRVAEGYRTFQEQADIYAQGRTKPGKVVTYSPPGTSYHNWGLAVDIAPIIFDANGKPKDLDWNFNFKTIRPIALAHGLQCGMDFPHPDMDHFENKFGMNWRDMLHKYTVKDFIAGTTYINI